MEGLGGVTRRPIFHSCGCDDVAPRPPDFLHGSHPVFHVTAGVYIYQHPPGQAVWRP